MTEIEREIRSEIAKAVRDLGGSPRLVATIEGKTKQQMYKAAERLGGDRYLLAAIGSWRDTMDDEDVLRDLRDWNAAEWETPPHLQRK
jgi:hypothetical protein